MTQKIDTDAPLRHAGRQLAYALGNHTTDYAQAKREARRTLWAMDADKSPAGRRLRAALWLQLAYLEAWEAAVEYQEHPTPPTGPTLGMLPAPVGDCL